MKNIFNTLYSLQSLDKKQSYFLFNKIINNKLNTIEVTSILIALKFKKESIDEIFGAIQAFQNSMLLFPRPKYIFGDITGTGGDGGNTINISTLSALVASSCGFKIIKHCNTGVSSALGSVDILNKLNINIHIDCNKSIKMLDKLNICFLFAPAYHPGFKYISQIRKQLKTKTIFNILGPLLNPSQPSIAVIGVYSKELLLPMAQIINLLNFKKVIIVHSDGIDEVTLHSMTDIMEIYDGKIYSYKLYPEDFGVPSVKKNFFVHLNSYQKYKIFKDICSGKSCIEYQNLIAINTAILFKAFGLDDLKNNTKIALKKIRSGKLKQHIKSISKMD